MPRAGLDTEAVVGAAEELADANGLETITLATLARQLGVRPPSLYAHVTGLPDLRRRLAARGARQLAAAMQTAAAGRARGDALAAVADAYRSYAREPRAATRRFSARPIPTTRKPETQPRPSTSSSQSCAATVSSRTTRSTRPASSAPPSTVLSHWKRAAASVSPSTSTKPSPDSRACSTRGLLPPRPARTHDPPLRRARLEARRNDRPDRLHRLVVVAPRCRSCAAHLTTGGRTALSALTSGHFV